MAALVGLLLAPVGAIIGSVIFFAVIFSFVSKGPVSFDEFIGMTIYGTIPGIAFAAPVTALVLPAIFGMMRRRSVVSLKGLTIGASAFGVVLVLVASIWIWWNGDGKADAAFWLMMLGLAAEAAFVAALCACLFGRIMRFLQPEAWSMRSTEPSA
jgi:hypothetical protein